MTKGVVPITENAAFEPPDKTAGMAGIAARIKVPGRVA
jgi:hypothetical protein